MEIRTGTTFDEFTILRQKDFPEATGELSKLLRDIGLAGKVIYSQINKAGLVGILGEANNVNVQGEDQQKLDVFANDKMIKFLRNGGQCAGVGSEEDDDVIIFENELSKEAKYIVLMDPLDGSSNIDVNVSVGTIFSIYKRLGQDQPVTKADFLQNGVEQVAAGYIVYGSSTMLVYTTGSGVHGFTLDTSIGEFCLSNYNIKFPESGKIYSVNQGNYHLFDKGVQNYIDYCMSDEGKKPFSARYIGSMVADFHRNLIKGGIFFYPSTTDAPKGKLRLLYECNPMAYLAEQAGGAATDGKTRILELNATELHQRTPVFIGNKEMVEEAMRKINEQ